MALAPLDRPRKYLATFFLAKPRDEHRRLVGLIDGHSGGDYKVAFMQAPKGQPSIVGYLFTSSLRPKHMGFADALLSGDKFLVVEVGDLHFDDGFNVARAWLQTRRSTPSGSALADALATAGTPGKERGR